MWVMAGKRRDQIIDGMMCGCEELDYMLAVVDWDLGLASEGRDEVTCHIGRS